MKRFGISIVGAIIGTAVGSMACVGCSHALPKPSVSAPVKGLSYPTPAPWPRKPEPWPSADDLDLRDMGKVFNDLQITAQAEATQVKVGKPIWVQVTFKNLSSQTYYFVDDINTERAFFLVVQNEQHHLVPFLKGADYLANHYVQTAGSDMTQPVLGHRTITYRVQVNYFCAMTKPGTYFITVKRKMLFEERKKNYPHNYYVANPVQVEVMTTLPADKQSRKPKAQNSDGRYSDHMTVIDPKDFPISSSQPGKTIVPKPHK